MSNKEKTTVESKTATNVIDPKKAEKKAKESELTNKILKLLINTKEGILVIDVAKQVGVDNPGKVRRFLRSAGVLGEKQGYTFIRETEKETNKKLYNLVKKN